MSRKIESWVGHIYNGAEDLVQKYQGLKGRELALLAAATIDIGLAHLIEKKLGNDPKEVELFLGLNGDGRAPVGSFGARIQLAYLLDLIPREEMELFRSIKAIRNIYAHKINVKFNQPDIASQILPMLRFMKRLNIIKEQIESGDITYEEIEKRYMETENKSEIIFILVFSSLVLVLNKRIEECKTVKQEAIELAKKAIAGVFAEVKNNEQSN